MNGELRGFLGGRQWRAVAGICDEVGCGEDFTETCGHCDISLNQASLEGNVAWLTSSYVAEPCFAVLCNSEGFALSRLVSSRPFKSESRYPEEGFGKLT